MAEVGRTRIPHEALLSLRRRLEMLPARHPDRKELVKNAATLYGVSRATLYRGLRMQLRLKPLHRCDRGKPKVLPLAEMERYCEIIAALKLRAMNGKGRHLSTARAIAILEEYGIETPDGPVQTPPGLLTKPTVNRYLRQWGFDHDRMTRAPAAVRFQAEHSNALWQFDLSPSDLKQVKQPSWAEPGRGAATLMIYSVVDDRSGVAYQEYRCVYGEDVEAGLRFLFNAMAPKLAQNLDDRMDVAQTRPYLFPSLSESLYTRRASPHAHSTRCGNIKARRVGSHPPQVPITQFRQQLSWHFGSRSSSCSPAKKPTKITHPIQAERTIPVAACCGCAGCPSISSLNLMPMLMSPCRAAWA